MLFNVPEAIWEGDSWTPELLFATSVFILGPLLHASGEYAFGDP